MPNGSWGTAGAGDAAGDRRRRRGTQRGISPYCLDVPRRRGQTAAASCTSSSSGYSARCSRARTSTPANSRRASAAAICCCWRSRRLTSPPCDAVARVSRHRLTGRGPRTDLSRGVTSAGPERPVSGVLEAGSAVRLRRSDDHFPATFGSHVCRRSTWRSPHRRGDPPRMDRGRIRAPRLRVFDA